jgi:hypothetical protein
MSANISIVCSSKCFDLILMWEYFPLHCNSSEEVVS